MPAPSGPSSSTLETPQPAGSTPALGPGGGATGSGTKGNYLIVCLGTTGGPPCVPASQGGYVIAAERALAASSQASVTGATFAASTCAAAGVSCGAGDTGAGIVTFTLSGGGKDRVLVVKHADGTLGAIALR